MMPVKRCCERSTQVRCIGAEEKVLCFQVGLKYRSFPRAKPSDCRNSEKGHRGAGLQLGGLCPPPPYQWVAWGSETSNCPNSWGFWELESQQGDCCTRAQSCAFLVWSWGLTAGMLTGTSLQRKRGTLNQGLSGTSVSLPEGSSVLRELSSFQNLRASCVQTCFSWMSLGIPDHMVSVV